MSNPMFNDDQNAHMEYLAGLPPETRCYCGWFEFGKHMAPSDIYCKAGKTKADRIRDELERNKV